MRMRPVVAHVVKRVTIRARMSFGPTMALESRPTRDTQGRSDQRSDRLVRRRVRLGSVCSPASAAEEQVGVALSGAEQVGTMRWFPVNADGAGRYVVHLVIEVNHYA
jgi:hypothetical protein